MKSLTIKELEREKIKESIKVFLLAFNRMNPEAVKNEKKTWECLIRNNIAKFHIALKNEKIIGVGGSFLYQHVGSIGYLGVLPEYRGRGVGTAIFRTLLESAINSGCETVMLYASNLGEPIYKKFGFQGTYYASIHSLLKNWPNIPIKNKQIEILDYLPDWLLSLDNKVVGYDRNEYLKARITLGAKAIIIKDEGYGLISEVLSRVRLGPLISVNFDSVLSIIKRGILLGADNLIIPKHPLIKDKLPNLLQLTEEEQDPNLRMIYGKKLSEKLEYHYAIGSYGRG
jgi:ribosomal-protein-alanine N-acetyltransferase